MKINEIVDREQIQRRFERIKEEILRLPKFKKMKNKFPFSSRKLMDCYAGSVIREVFREIEKTLDLMEKLNGKEGRYITDFELEKIKKAFVVNE